VEAEYLGAGKADDKAEHLLLVGREGGGLDAERAVAGVAEHLLALAVPRHRVRVRLLYVSVDLSRDFVIVVSILGYFYGEILLIFFGKSELLLKKIKLFAVVSIDGYL
jgi:hypothetical protein